MKLPTAKFSDPYITMKGESRAWVSPHKLTTLWFNTGTLCNLACANCYIESSPTNDALVYMTAQEIKPFLRSVQAHHPETQEIGLTGGEPFLNPHIMDILIQNAELGFTTLTLTNAMKPLAKLEKPLEVLTQSYPDQFSFRVSMDHYLPEIHEKERGPRSWTPMLEGIEILMGLSCEVSIAGRMLTDETETQMREGYAKLFESSQWEIDAMDPKALVLFPEMDANKDVPEITSQCWSILEKNPNDIMCAGSRMVVKKKGAATPEVIACTLLPYEKEFSLGTTLEEAWKPVSLNHPHCATFCVLGGSSCS